MALAIVYCRASSGIHAPLITVEVHLSYGHPGFRIVGLPETAVKESKDRVRSALMNTHFEYPIRHITVNLAPAELPKEGARFDLAIALGILAASEQLPKEKLLMHEFYGELALSGELRPMKGVLPVVLAATHAGKQPIVPYQNSHEASLVEKANVLCANHLLEVCAYLQHDTPLLPCVSSAVLEKKPTLNLADVKGQPHAKRALEVAAAGQHSLMLMGPPGTGKTMLANRLTSLLPELSEEEALEIAAVASVSMNGFDSATWRQIPFRAPHHTSSAAALVGGGRPPRPGEISLAHRGVLLLDELPEYHRHVLESLREPLEFGSITISRAAFQTTFPAKFQFLATMNPCPCGYASSSEEECRCSPEQVKRYLAKISGPLLDRIDMHVEVARLPADVLTKANMVKEEDSQTVRERVMQSRAYQYERQGKCNAALTASEIESKIVLEGSAIALLNQVMTRFNLSARVYHRIIKLARTLADLDACQDVAESHISEAISYRCLDRRRGG